MFTFYSQSIETKTYGKKSFQQSALKAFFMNVKPAPQGWFAAPVSANPDTVLKIMARVAAKVPDLIVEDAAGNRVELPVAA